MIYGEFDPYLWNLNLGSSLIRSTWISLRDNITLISDQHKSRHLIFFEELHLETK